MLHITVECKWFVSASDAWVVVCRECCAPSLLPCCEVLGVSVGSFLVFDLRASCERRALCV